MENQKVSERREMNETLAMMAKNGNNFAVNQLWEINQGILHKFVWQAIRGKEEQLAMHGLKVEDLDNELYFALLDAVERYDPERGGFLNVLAIYARKAIQKAFWGEHVRTVTDNNTGKQYRVSGNPINSAERLDAPLPGHEEDEGTTKLDFVADPQSAGEIAAVDDQLEQESIKKAVWEAVDRLPEVERNAIIAHDLALERKTYKEIGKELGICGTRVAQILQKGMQKLRADRRLKQIHDELYGSKIYSGSFGSWKRTGSVEERLAEMREAEDKRYAAIQAEAERRRKEFTQRTLGITPDGDNQDTSLTTEEA